MKLLILMALAGTPSLAAAQTDLPAASTAIEEPVQPVLDSSATAAFSPASSPERAPALDLTLSAAVGINALGVEAHAQGTIHNIGVLKDWNRPR
jgi:hypothetical protein